MRLSLSDSALLSHWLDWPHRPDWPYRSYRPYRPDGYRHHRRHGCNGRYRRNGCYRRHGRNGAYGPNRPDRL